MITALQTFFFKHNTWLFSALLVVVIVTFVLTIGNQNLGGAKTYEVERREYYGYDLNRQADQVTLMQHAELSLRMDPMKMYSMAFARSIRGIQDYAFVRIAALGLANQIGIPNPNEEELKAFLKSRSAFQNPQTGEFDQSAYTQFTDSLATNPNADSITIGKVLREDYRIERLREAFAGPGYLLPFEAEKGYLMQETEWTVEVASTDYDAFSPALDLNEEKRIAYYEENPNLYTLPERVRISTVNFRANSFLSEVPDPEPAVLEAYFAKNRSRYQAPTPPTPPTTEGVETPPAAPEVTLAEVRDQVLADYRRSQAIPIAQAQSEEFLAYLYENQIAKNSEAFTAALAQFKGEMRPLAPFSRGNPPTTTGLPTKLLQSAWVYAANASRYYSDLEATSDGAGLILVDELIPEELQSYDTVASQVATDLAAQEKRRLFSEQVAAWEAAMNAALAAGTPFPTVAESVGFTVTTPEPFKVTDLPEEIDARTWDATQTLNKGEHSPIVIDQKGASMTYVVEKMVPTVDSSSAQETEYFSQVVEQRRETGGWFALAQWTSETLKRLNPEDEETSL